MDKTLADWQQRVVTEWEELVKKFDALTAFFKTNNFKGLEAPDRALLQKQHAHMRDYINTLSDRMERWKK